MQNQMTIRIGASHNEVSIQVHPAAKPKVYDLGNPDRAERARLRAFIVREWKRNRASKRV